MVTQDKAETVRQRWAYTVGDDDERYAVPRALLAFTRYPSLLAEGLAEAIFDNADWKTDWPLVLRFFCNGELVGHYSVDMKLEPAFTAQSEN